MTRALLAVLLSATALACSEKPEVKPEPAPSPAPTGSAGSLAQRPGPEPAEAPVDRSPIALTDSAEKLTLSGTTLDLELVDERARYYVEGRQLLVHPLRDHMLVTYAGYVMLLGDHRLEPIKPLWPQEAYEFTAIVGAWPHAVAAQVEFDSWASPGFQRSAPVRETQQYLYTGGDWGGIQVGAGTKAAAWRTHTILALRDTNLSVVQRGESPPKQAPPRDAERCKGTPTEVVPEALDALPSGEAFVVGHRCGGGAYAVERWPSDGSDSVIEDLPDPPAAAKRAFMAAGSGDKGHVLLSTGDKVYAARWDGRAFRKLELRAEGDVRAAWTAADGTLFFVLQYKSSTPKNAKGELVRVLASGEVARSPHFAVSSSTKVWAADARTAYLSSFGSILSTKPGLVIVAPKKEEPAARAAAPAPPASGLPPYAEGCATPFVFLYDVSSQSPPGYDFPGTRKALSTFARVGDISLVEFMHTSKRRLGLRVPSAEVGKEAMAHVVANMKDEHPELVCLDPKEGVRVISIR